MEHGYGFAVSDSFTVPTNSDIETLSIVYWDNTTFDLLTTVDMAISTSPLPSPGFQTIAASNTFLGFNGFGYALYQADFAFTSIPWSGAGWVTLQNACTTLGCSDFIAAAYWDENDGPSLAFQNTTGAIGSEAFSLDGTVGTTTPEPGSIRLLGLYLGVVWRSALQDQPVKTRRLKARPEANEGKAGDGPLRPFLWTNSLLTADPFRFGLTL